MDDFPGILQAPFDEQTNNTGWYRHEFEACAVCAETNLYTPNIEIYGCITWGHGFSFKYTQIQNPNTFGPFLTLTVTSGERWVSTERKQSLSGPPADVNVNNILGGQPSRTMWNKLKSNLE